MMQPMAIADDVVGDYFNSIRATCPGSVRINDMIALGPLTSMFLKQAINSVPRNLLGDMSIQKEIADAVKSALLSGMVNKETDLF